MGATVNHYTHEFLQSDGAPSQAGVELLREALERLDGCNGCPSGHGPEVFAVYGGRIAWQGETYEEMIADDFVMTSATVDALQFQYGRLLRFRLGSLGSSDFHIGVSGYLIRHCSQERGACHFTTDDYLRGQASSWEDLLRLHKFLLP